MTLRRALLTVLCTGLPIAATGLAGAPAAGAFSSTPDRTWVPDGPVSSIARSGNTLYIGGLFDRIGPRTGPGIGFSQSTGANVGLPEVSGGDAYVTSSIPDGTGGFYIGGQFTRVGGIARNNVAHIRADGSVDPKFDADVTGTASGNYFAVVAIVCALSLSPDGSTLYLGGSFSHVGGQLRHAMAAVSAIDGAPTGFNANISQQENGLQGIDHTVVNALGASGSVVYAGGNFNSTYTDGVGQLSRAGLAAFDATSGHTTSWNPGASGGSPSTETRALAVSGDGMTVFVSGIFTSISGQSRTGFAALNAGDGQATPLNPSPGNYLSVLALSGNTLYLGNGDFTVNGHAHRTVAAFNLATGSVTGFDPNPGGGDPNTPLAGHVAALAVAGSIVYATGNFGSIGGQSRRDLAALNASDGSATAVVPPSPNSQLVPVVTLAVSGSTVYAGGYFNSTDGVVRKGIAAIDATTGVATGWDPNGSAGTDVHALAVSGDGATIYAGGYFGHIGGQARFGLAALKASDGTATTWDPIGPGGSAVVNALALSGSTVYVGGEFGQMGGQSRNNIAAVHAGDGLATAFDPGNGSNVFQIDAMAVSPDALTVYVGGAFSSLGGQPRNGLAAVGAANGVATSFNANTSAHTEVTALALSGPLLYISGSFGASTGGQPRNGLAALNISDGTATAWNPAVSQYVQAKALLVSGTHVLVGGGFNTIGGQPRTNLAEVNASDGKATAWNPGPNGTVDALALGADGTLYVGGDFQTMELAAANSFGAFNSSGVDDQPPVAAFTASPNAVLTGQSVAFNGTGSSDPDGTVSSYRWDFGDATVSTSSAPTHSYAVTGVYTVKLTVTDNSGSTNTTSHMVTVNDRPPVGAFTATPNPVVSGQTVTFDGGASNDPDGQVTTYAWDFGDGNFGSGVAPTWTYNAAGVYTVKLTVTDNSGTTNTVSHMVTVSDRPPVAAFTISPNPGGAGQQITFNGTGSTDPDGQVTAYAWDFGDSTTGTGAIAYHTYGAASQAGGYTVKLTVTDNSGTTNVVSHTVTVSSQPVPVNQVAPGIAGMAAQGLSLAANQGSWTNGPTSYSYHWQQCNTAGTACANIFGGTAKSYGLNPGDVGHTIRVQETATNGGGDGVPATSAPTGIVQGPAGSGSGSGHGSGSTTTGPGGPGTSPGGSNRPTVYELKLLNYCDPSSVPASSLPPGSVVNNSAGGPLHAIVQSGPGTTTLWFHIDSPMFQVFLAPQGDTYHGTQSVAPNGLPPHSDDQGFGAASFPTEDAWWGGLNYGSLYTYHAWASLNGGPPVEGPPCPLPTPPKPKTKITPPATGSSGITVTVDPGPGPGTATLTADPVPPVPPGPVPPGPLAPRDDPSAPPHNSDPCIIYQWMSFAPSPGGAWFPFLNPAIPSCIAPKAIDLSGVSPVWPKYLPRGAAANNTLRATRSPAQAPPTIASIKLRLKSGKNKVTLRFSARARRAFAHLAHHGRVPVFVIVAVKAVGGSPIITHTFKVSVPVGRHR